MASKSYSYKKLLHSAEEIALQDLPQQPATEAINPDPLPLPGASQRQSRTRTIAFIMIASVLVLLTTLSLAHAVWFGRRAATTTPSTTSTEVPQYFQTTPEIFAGELLLPHHVEESHR